MVYIAVVGAKSQDLIVGILRSHVCSCSRHTAASNLRLVALKVRSLRFSPSHHHLATCLIALGYQVAVFVSLGSYMCSGSILGLVNTPCDLKVS